MAENNAEREARLTREGRRLIADGKILRFLIEGGALIVDDKDVLGSHAEVESRVKEANRPH
jgi:hypothetical protein